jgi:hypothetical protein
VKYALLIYSSDAPGTFDSMTEEEQQSVIAEYFAISALPEVYGGAQLQPVETATTVRVENGTPLTTDGPFVEMKELFGGFYLVEADNIDAALEIAARVPAARLDGAVEVRPLVER